MFSAPNFRFDFQANKLILYKIMITQNISVCLQLKTKQYKYELEEYLSTYQRCFRMKERQRKRRDLCFSHQMNSILVILPDE